MGTHNAGRRPLHGLRPRSLRLDGYGRDAQGLLRLAIITACVQLRRAGPAGFTDYHWNGSTNPAACFFPPRFLLKISSHALLTCPCGDRRAPPRQRPNVVSGGLEGPGTMQQRWYIGKGSKVHPCNPHIDDIRAIFGALPFLAAVLQREGGRERRCLSLHFYCHSAKD